MKLVFIIDNGINYQNKTKYEFIFSSSPFETFGEDWNTNFPEPPNEEFISEVRFLVTDEIDLNLATETSIFTMYDIQEGIVALAWEDNYEQEDYNRLIFKYGDTIYEIEEKLRKRNHSFELI